ncbi:sarcosine oxidase subunit gamma [Taklimakanibacter lacteus]|uniref:sarcosine oxidase subunit gamma n=1 Tax=Taklimakanibacter lacteus TaxID=2268456 RepID=UPI0013C534D3
MPKVSSAVQRVSALADVAVQGRFGADKGAPGVTLSVRHPMSIVTVIARKGRSDDLGKAIEAAYKCSLPAVGASTGKGAISFHWCGAEQYYAIAEGKAEGELYRDLKARLEGLASCSDQSHGRVILRVSGPKARTLLAKGTPIDLHPAAFGPGKSAVTQMAHVGVHLVQTGKDEFELSVFRGFSESFWEWLTEQSEEYGYQVL